MRAAESFFAPGIETINTINNSFSFNGDICEVFSKQECVFSVIDISIASL